MYTPCVECDRAAAVFGGILCQGCLDKEKAEKPVILPLPPSTPPSEQEPQPKLEDGARPQQITSPHRRWLQLLLL